jgi:N-acetylneuraminic acid mutarotase
MTTLSTATAWKNCAPFPEPTWELEGVECHGRIYLIGGITNVWAAKTDWKPNRFVYEYNPQADSWSRKTSLPLPLHHMAVTQHQGLIYGFGGYKTPDAGPDDWQPVANAWTYDPIQDHWSALPQLPEARGASAASVLNGKIYIAGGSFACHRKGQSAKQGHPHTSSAKVFVFDPVTQTYGEAAPLLTARNHHLLETLNGKLYALGGRVGSSNAFTSSNKIDLVEEYDPADDTWWPKSRMLAPHGGMMSCIHGGAIYVSGGDAFRMVEKYDVAQDRWTIAAELPRARMGASGGCIDGKLYVITGHIRTETGSQPVPDNLVLDLT